MSIECGECEMDARVGHDETCSRHPFNRVKKVEHVCCNGPWVGHKLWIATEGTLPLILDGVKGYYRSKGSCLLKWIPL